ncbi:MAG: hypothetical protein ACOZB3_00385 [Calditrichota bacterium]
MKTYVLLLIVATSMLPSFAQNVRELDEHGYLLRDGFNRRPRAVQTRLTGFTAKKWTDWDRVNTEIAFSQAFALFRSPIEMSYTINTYGGVGNSETWRFKFELGFAVQVLRGANDEYGFAPRIAGTVKPSDSPTLYNLDVGNETISLILPVSVRWNEKLSTVFNAGLAYNEYKTWDWNYFFFGYSQSLRTSHGIRFHVSPTTPPGDTSGSCAYKGVCRQRSLGIPGSFL